MTEVSVVTIIVVFLLGVSGGIGICEGLNKMALAKKTMKKVAAKKKTTKKASKKK
jgi:hypothetical protein